MNTPRTILCQLDHVLMDIYQLGQLSHALVCRSNPSCSYQRAQLQRDLQELQRRFDSHRAPLNEHSFVLQTTAPAYRQLVLGVTCNANKLLNLSRTGAQQPELDEVATTLAAAWSTYRRAFHAAV